MPADYPDDQIDRMSPGAAWLDAGWRHVLAMLRRFAES